MFSVTFSGGSPTVLATAYWSPVWNCSPFQTSQRSASSLTTQSSGSIAACARYGKSNDASTFLAAPASAFAASPSPRATVPGVAASLRNSAKISAERP